VIEDNVVKKFDTEGFTGVFQPFCDLDIFPAWCKSALIFFDNSDAVPSEM
jgi:hypothetical protein